MPNQFLEVLLETIESEVLVPCDFGSLRCLVVENWDAGSEHNSLDSVLLYKNYLLSFDMSLTVTVIVNAFSFGSNAAVFV